MVRKQTSGHHRNSESGLYLNAQSTLRNVEYKVTWSKLKICPSRHDQEQLANIALEAMLIFPHLPNISHTFNGHK